MSVLRKIWGRKKARKQTPEWALPEGMLVYAIGDIHGRFDLLQQLLAQIERDRAARYTCREAYVVFLGDYVDRGFQSREVIDFLSEYQPIDMRPVFLRGNHEDLMLKFIDDPMEADLWLGVGGVATLASYGVQMQEKEGGQDIMQASEALGKALPSKHRAFLDQLHLSWRAGDYFFVHAGLRPGVRPEEQTPRDLMGIRQDFTLANHNFGFCVVHGHTGVREPEHNGVRIAVDTGAFATGKLTAAILQGSHANFISTA